MQPQVFRQMRANLASMWSSSKRAVKLRRLYAKTSSLAKSNGKNPSLEHEESTPTNDDNITMKVVRITSALSHSQTAFTIIS